MIRQVDYMEENLKSYVRDWKKYRDKMTVVEFLEWMLEDIETQLNVSKKIEERK